MTYRERDVFFSATVIGGMLVKETVRSSLIVSLGLTGFLAFSVVTGEAVVEDAEAVSEAADAGSSLVSVEGVPSGCTDSVELPAAKKFLIFPV